MERATRRILGILGTLVLVFVFGAGASFYEDYLKPVFNPQPTPTNTPFLLRPNPTPKSTIVPVVTDNPCLLWSEVTTQMEGSTVCVYGTVYSFYETENSWTRIKFSTLSDTFFIEDIFYTYPDLKPGDCVQAVGTVRLYGRIPHMQINGELYTCQ